MIIFVLIGKKRCLVLVFSIEKGSKIIDCAKKAPARFELATSSLLDWRSNQLSYGAVDKEGNDFKVFIHGLTCAVNVTLCGLLMTTVSESVHFSATVASVKL